MELFYFLSDTHQLLIPSKNLENARNSFLSAAQNIYGKTLKGIEVESEFTITVSWLEEDEHEMMSDTFQIGTLPLNTVVSFHGLIERPSFLLPDVLEPKIETSKC